MGDLFSTLFLMSIGFLIAWLWLKRGQGNDATMDGQQAYQTIIKDLEEQIKQLKVKLKVQNEQISDLKAQTDEGYHASIAKLQAEVLGKDLALSTLKSEMAILRAKLEATQQSVAQQGVAQSEEKSTKEKETISQKPENKPKSTAKKLTKQELTFQEKAKSDPNFPKKKLDIAVVNASYAHLKDDLKQIKGIGLYTEMKLNAVGIQNFQQIANLDSADIEKVTKGIKFVTGKIERDDWVGQAKTLLKRW